MKAVDITLVFQIIYFFIAYYMLRTYVFYPVLEILLKKEEEQGALQGNIDKAFSKHQEVINQKKYRWEAIVSKLHALVPKKVVHADGLLNQSLKKHYKHDEVSMNVSERKKIKDVILQSILREKI